ncbi:hypothetical protein ABIA44_005345 [Bradyrhizobium sp. USDA 329]
MSHRTSRGTYGRETGIIDLGHEPPLSVDGSEAAVIDRRRVSVQWFSGTILTGLCGAALIGGAVFASLDGEMTFAKVPERVEGALRGAFGAADRAATLHKSDRLPPPSESTASRNIMRVSTVARVGNRDVMRVRPFVRIAGNLSMTTSDLSAKIPPFNAQRLLTDVGSDPKTASDDPNNPEAVEPDAEVSFVTKDLSSVLPKAKISAVVALDDILMRVRDAANWRGNGGVRYASLANATADVSGTTGPSDIKMAYAAEASSSDPYAGFETRVVPENVTLLPKTKEQITGGNPNGERVHLVKKGDSVGSVLRDLGATADEIKAITATLGPRGRDGGLKEGEKLRILMAPSSPGARLQPYRVVVANDTVVEAIAALSDLGKYVAVDVSSMNTVADAAANANSEDDDEDDGSGVRLYQSIYETAMRNKVPMPVIEDMIKIYSYDVDFQRKVQPGDSFDVFYAGEDEGVTSSEKNEVLFASLTVGGETKKYYRYQSPDDGVVDYYDETGKSAKKFLVRKPGQQRHHALGLRRPPPPDPGLREDAYRRRLVHRLRHADLRLRQRHDREGRPRGRLWQVHPHQARQRLRDRLRPYVGLRQGHGARQEGTAGPGDRLRRLVGPVDRPARPLRDPGQRPLRRPDAREAAARPFAGRPDAGQLREGARPARRHDERPRRRHRPHVGRHRRTAAGHQPLSREYGRPVGISASTIRIRRRRPRPLCGVTTSSFVCQSGMRSEYFPKNGRSRHEQQARLRSLDRCAVIRHEPIG